MAKLVLEQENDNAIYMTMWNGASYASDTSPEEISASNLLTKQQ